ncbi:MAG TPA: NAD(P)H-binding protein [Tepidiformaceae bacterium]
MKVLVAGGTGFLGREITRQLASSGHEVTVLSRSDPGRNPVASEVHWIQGDVTRPETLAPALAGFDVVVDAVQFPGSPFENPKKGWTFERIDLQGTRNLVEAARTVGTPLFIGISGVGAAAGATYHWLRFKWDEEQAIINSGVPYTIFRPAWVYGPGDVSLNRFLGFAKVLPFVPVIGDGKMLLNPLFVTDLGDHVAAAVAGGSIHRGLFEIGGPDRISMNEIIRTALEVAGKRRFLLHQPKAVMKAIAALAQFAPGRPLTPDGIDFVTMEAIADTTALMRAFGLPLTPLSKGLATYLS